MNLGSFQHTSTLLYPREINFLDQGWVSDISIPHNCPDDSNEWKDQNPASQKGLHLNIVTITYCLALGQLLNLFQLVFFPVKMELTVASSWGQF